MLRLWPMGYKFIYIFIPNSKSMFNLIFVHIIQKNIQKLFCFQQKKIVKTKFKPN